ncbi:MAG: DNA double-strand break repair ATPase Rad50 [Archaeoglobaceae archaeon]
MIIKEIVLKNFKSHANTRVRFEKGINLIAGRNGAGKSSILEAILVALYGIRQPMRKDDLIHIGTTDYSVELTFELNGRDYRIIRRSTGNSELKGDFQLDGEKKINEWIEKTILPFHVFTGAVYVRQGEIETIISDESGREKIIRKITRIEDYENAWKNLGQVLRELENEKKRYLEVVRQKEDCEKRLKEKILENASIEDEIKRSSSYLDELKKTLLKIEKERESLDSIKSQIEKLKVEVLKFESEIKNLESRADFLISRKGEVEKEISELKMKAKKAEILEKDAKTYLELLELQKSFVKAMQNISEKIKNLEVERERILAEIRRCEGEREKIGKIGEEIKELEEKLRIYAPEMEKWKEVKAKIDRKNQIEKILTEKGYSVEKIEKMFLAIQKARERDKALKDEFEKLNRQKGALSSEERRLREIIGNLKTAIGKCPTCGRELSDEEKAHLMANYSSQISRIEKELSSIEEVEKRLREERKRISDILEKQDAVLKYKQLVDELKKIAEAFKTVEVEKLEELSSELEKCTTRLEFLREEEKKIAEVLKEEPKIKERFDLVKVKLSELEGQKNAIFSDLKNRGFSSLEELEKELAELKAKYEEWAGVKNAKKDVEEAETSLKKLENEIGALKELILNKRRELKEKEGFLAEFERKYDQKRHEELQKEERRVAEEIAGIEERLQVLQKTLETLRKDREYLQKQLELIQESEEKVKVIERAIPELEKIREKFASYKNMIAENSLKEVEKYASEIFEEFTEGKYSGIKLKRVLEYGKERLRIFVVHQGEERETSFLSGGELVALGIAFRLALSMFEARGRIPLLIMDEPTPFLDEERRRKLVEITMNYLRRIPQVIVVSHDEELKDAADRVIAVEYRGGVSFVASQ